MYVCMYVYIAYGILYVCMFHYLSIWLLYYQIGLSNLSMSHINYTAKVLFKSAQPVVTIVIGNTYIHSVHHNVNTIY